MSDKQQTALRNVINKFDEIKDLDPSVQILILRGECEANLELEKQQIIDARVDGMAKGIEIGDNPINYRLHETHEQYFNKTFKTESNGTT